MIILSLTGVWAGGKVWVDGCGGMNFALSFKLRLFGKCNGASARPEIDPDAVHYEEVAQIILTRILTNNFMNRQ